MSNGRASPPEGAILVEFVRQGAWLKCSAVCSRTGTEAAAVGPASDPSALERLAVMKLNRLLAK
ncbi:hypothetical protein [Caulobacter sp. 17J65-9]|uniref:DUF6898 family protein n=1 Tax=Caulobacter sp. 17J65-9 TaxID=2709382 RepID=UPI0013CD0F1C|nr:hypothetical protein [Caulobacter sp. 17J65-9]NEX92070.1 hypothetical protein [Caulobacter sp. 17J65-9]